MKFRFDVPNICVVNVSVCVNDLKSCQYAATFQEISTSLCISFTKEFFFTNILMFFFKYNGITCIIIYLF